jgi:hypothetical protein
MARCVHEITASCHYCQYQETCCEATVGFSFRIAVFIPVPPPAFQTDSASGGGGPKERGAFLEQVILMARMSDW